MKLFIPAERRAEAVEILQTLQLRLEICHDFLGGSIQERDYPRSHIIYAERWSSKEAICEHIRSWLYRRLLTVIELSDRAPEIGFYFVSHTKGMELIQALRDNPKQTVEAS